MKQQRRFALTSDRISPESVARLTGICILTIEEVAGSRKKYKKLMIETYKGGKTK